MRTGRQFLESLNDGRAVYLDGDRVADVTRHPAFAEPIRQVATMYDLARERWDPDTTTYVEPATGARTSAMWLILAGFAGSPDVFARGGQQFADNLLRFYARARDEDLFIPYAVVPPQGDR